VRGGVPVRLDTSPSAWVLKDSQIESAIVIIKRYDSGATSGAGSTSSRQCPQCGEHVEGHCISCLSD
jgi:hypothetical protein